MSSSSTPLAPTFYGHIASTQDALLLFEACLSGALAHVARRPHDRERANLIKSGNVFIYEEHSSGIKRWTDGVPWSPSRILGNFLVYRELERPFPPGEKKRAMKKSKRSPGINKSDSYSITNSSISTGYNPAVAVANSTFETPNSNSLSKETERSLIGSLVDSYGFKEEGLVKKTVSVTVGNISHHLVSYYTVADVMNNKFTTPSKDPRFQQIVPRQDLVTKQNFRTPIDEIDPMDRVEERTVFSYPTYSSRTGYEMTNQTISQQRSLSLPTPPHTYPPTSTGVFGNYSVNSQAGSYDGLTSGQSAPSFTNHLAQSQGMYPGPVKNESYHLPGYRQQRFNSVSSIPSDTARSQMPSVLSSFARRPSNYEQANSIDSGINPSTDSKPNNDHGYQPHGSNLYNVMRETNNSHNNYTPQRSLPTPSQPHYDRNPVQVYHHPVENLSLKESMWSLGNVNAGHGHYINTPQQWASTGTS
ncbi:Global transcription regulator sge1 [Erysiphe necator]|uniref:Putative gti1 pac2 family protein n=1 Tax=Uncinula necator TaxID=52586 RepID=A0A0B1PCH5_UNCNE|nr:Global transcription regulator sge1 [Erysiphe necator]KHJ34329.1 putative gti1 pac2 family protein [Erysiphe necator]